VRFIVALPFSGRVNHAKQVDSHSDTRNVCRASLRCLETEPREEQENGHQWEHGQLQIVGTERVGGVERRQGEELVDHAEAERSRQGGGLGELGVDEDLGGVVGGGVDAAELLHEVVNGCQHFPVPSCMSVRPDRHCPLVQDWLGRIMQIAI
jgi:hypothetical protein